MSRARDEPRWRAVAAEQAGVIARRQLLSLGMTPGQLRAVRSRERWQSLYQGIYLTHSGELSTQSRLWAVALLYGPPSAFSHGTAAALHGLDERFPPRIYVSVDRQRRLPRHAGLVVHRVERLEERVHPTLRPARTTVEHTVLDLVHAASNPSDVVDVVMRACQRRLTTPSRLRTAAARRPRLAHRSLVDALLCDVDAGAETPLERAYLVDVERAHGLPPGRRQVRGVHQGGSVWRDVVYDEFATIVELDGRRGHEEVPFRDLTRDNAACVDGLGTLRYGWHATVRDPCGVASQVGRVLRRQGWTGMLRSCGPQCTARMPGIAS